MEKNPCKQCERLNNLLGAKFGEVYVEQAVCDDCWEKQVDEYEKEKKMNTQD